MPFAALNTLATTHEQSPLLPDRPRPLEYTRLPFNHPLYIWFSSGTTGPPKSIFERFIGIRCHGDWTEITPGGGISHALANPDVLDLYYKDPA